MKEITDFKGVKDLYYFLMNTLNLVLFKGQYYCFCKKFEKIKKSVPFTGNLVNFEDFEKKLYYNMDNFVLLKAYHAKLVPYLVKIFDTDETAIECFLNVEHIYSGPD